MKNKIIFDKADNKEQKLRVRADLYIKMFKEIEKTGDTASPEEFVEIAEVKAEVEELLEDVKDKMQTLQEYIDALDYHSSRAAKALKLERPLAIIHSGKLAIISQNNKIKIERNVYK